MTASSLPPTLILIAVPLIAFLYASVGFGGASGYLAAMSQFSIPPPVMASTALVLNMVVSSLAFVAYWRARHFQARLLLPFLVTSIPGAFIGGALPVDAETYLFLLYASLTYVALRMLFAGRATENSSPPKVPFSLWLAGLCGAVIGLLSGVIGVGGGIFLSPLIVLTGWGTPKQAAASAAGFIFINSMSGVLGRLVGGNLELDTLGWSLIPLGLFGGLLGSYLGARHLSNLALRRILGLILSIAVLRYWASILLGWIG